jgi:hypothetical protein
LAGPAQPVLLQAAGGADVLWVSSMCRRSETRLLQLGTQPVLVHAADSPFSSISQQFKSCYWKDASVKLEALQAFSRVESVVMHIMGVVLRLQEGSAEFVGYGDAVLTQLLAGGWQDRRHHGWHDGLHKPHLACRKHTGTGSSVSTGVYSKCLVQQSQCAGHAQS